MKRGWQFAMVAMLLGLALPAVAEEEGEEQLQAIQNRKHVLRHELGVGIGTIPIDPYYKGLTGSAHYTFHFNHTWGWEVFHVGYSKNFWTSLRKDLEENWRNPSSPQVIPEVQILGDTNIVFRPLYGKLAHLNRSLVYGEFSLTAGVAGAYYQTKKAYVGGDVGFGMRVFLSKHWSTRFDVRYYRLQQVDKFSKGDNVLFLQLGVALNLGGSK